MIHKRDFLKGLAGSVISSVAPLAWSQAWPSRPVRLLETNAAGSATDLIVRSLGPLVQSGLGQSLVVENRPGASGNIAAQALLGAPADGYTLLHATNNLLAANPHLFQTSRLDVLKDFEYICPLFNVGMAIVVRADSPWRSLTELIDDARRKPGQISYGTPGVGTPMHFVIEQLKHQTRVDLQHVPYKGGPLIVADLLANQLGVGIFAFSVAAPLVQQGRLRALAVAGSQRLAMMPDVPAVGEVVKEASLGAWSAIVAPKAVPRDIRAELTRHFSAAVRNPEIIEKFKPMGVDPMPGNEVTMAATVRAEYERFGELVKRLDLKVS